MSQIESEQGLLEVQRLISRRIQMFAGWIQDLQNISRMDLDEPFCRKDEFMDIETRNKSSSNLIKKSRQATKTVSFNPNLRGLFETIRKDLMADPALNPKKTVGKGTS